MEKIELTEQEIELIMHSVAGKCAATNAESDIFYNSDYRKYQNRHNEYKGIFDKMAVLQKKAENRLLAKDALPRLEGIKQDLGKASLDDMDNVNFHLNKVINVIKDEIEEETKTE